MTTNIKRIAISTGLILLIPLILTIHDGGVEGVGWNWGPGDFIIMGILLFSTGLALDYAVRKVTDPAYRTLSVIGVVFIALAIWTELAVGAVSQLVTYLFY